MRPAVAVAVVLALGCVQRAGPAGGEGATGATGPSGVPNASPFNYANTIVTRDDAGSFSAESLTLGSNLFLPGPTGATGGNIMSEGAPVLSVDVSNGNAFLGVGGVVPVSIADAGGGVTSGVANVAVGVGAGSSNTTGAQNTAVGTGSLSSTTTGGFNVSVGYETLFSNVGGGSNTAVGFSALPANVSGSSNVAIGTDALYSSTGSNNIAVGNSAGFNLAAGDDNIYIGSAGPTGATGETGTIRIGNPAQQTVTYVAGISGAMVAGTQVCVGSGGVLAECMSGNASSKRFKDDVRDIGPASRVLMRLRPVSFRYKPEYDPECRQEYGLIAEEVARTDPDLVTFDAAGQPRGVRYNLVNALLLNEVQTQRHEIDSLRSEASSGQISLESLVQRQQKEIEDLNRRLMRLESGAIKN